jgi:hypothetical protein
MHYRMDKGAVADRPVVEKKQPGIAQVARFVAVKHSKGQQSNVSLGK